MAENAIVFLVRSHEDEINLLNQCLDSLASNLTCTLLDADLIFFVEENFTALKKLVRVPDQFSNKVIFYSISLEVPEDQLFKYGELILDFFPHPTHSSGPVAHGHPGFNIGYRSMCRFFSGEMFKLPIMQNYRYYIRLDCDSRFERGLSISLFDWFTNQNLNYAFIKSAIQLDHPDVVRGLKQAVLEYMPRRRRVFYPRYFGRKMYYTNFEMGSLAFFTSSRWLDLYEFLDARGGFYLNRWGDAPVRYAGLWATSNRKRIRGIPPGFRYFHGDYFES